MKIVRLKRYAKNPILMPVRQSSWECKHVSNAAATIYNEKVYILYRAEGNELRENVNWPVAKIGLAISMDGFNIDCRYENPILEPGGIYQNAVEDPRITKIGDIYYIVYVGTSYFGDRILLAMTKDFRTLKKEGLLMPDVSQRTSGLFPEKINGEYVLLHRILPNIWISYSKDLKEWHNSKVIMKTRLNSWEELKIGIGAPPIKTKNAWLLFYHGVDRDLTYKLGIAWLDLKDPSKVIKRQEEPILEPEEDYEREGFTPNVVYTCGAVEKNGQYLVYYGCDDEVLAVATVKKEDVKI